MDLARARKRALVAEFFDILLEDREPITMGEHARRAAAALDGLLRLEPVFDH
jgi:hypothetical protein